MIYLILAILSSALVSTMMRLGEGRIESNAKMFVVNYLVCIVLSRIFMGNIRLFENGIGVGTAVGIGILSGILYLVSFVMLQQNIRKNGIIMASVFMKLGVIVPILMAMIVFREKPQVTQILGIALAVSAIILINFEKDGVSAVKNKALLIILLLCGGITDSMANIYDKIGKAEWKDHYLFYTFAAAFLCAIIMWIFESRKESLHKTGKNSILFGLLVGIPNYFSARFLLLALGSVPAVIAYPVYSVATIVVISLIGAFFYKESLSAKKKAAIGIVAVALILLNI